MEWSNAQASVAGIFIASICWGLARTEPARPPQKAAPVPLEKRPDYGRVLWMSAFLSWISGIVNAVCILEMSMTVSHQTGNMSHTGRLLGIDSQRFAASIIGFIVGSMAAGFGRCDGDAVYNGRYSAGLLASAVAVAGAVGIQWTSGQALVTVPLFAYSQGIQNAVTRKFSSVPVCTTHFTGYATDAGSGLGAWLAALVEGEPLPTLRRPIFFLLSILTFVLGGYAAKLGTDQWGVLVCLIPAALLAVTSMGVLPPASEGNKFA